MQKLVEGVDQANEQEIEELLKAVLHRYAVLLPDLEVSAICLDKYADRNEQLDRIIQVLQKMKESS